MGCMCTRDAKKESSPKEENSEKKYTWDQRKATNFNPNDYIIENLNNAEAIRVPGSVNGQQFIIQNCKDSVFYILDHLNTVTVDDCINCKIILGPVKGSVFIRNCKSCVCVTACGQFRARDSRKLHVFLYSATQPIIEASSGIHFGSYQLHYENIESHIEKADLKLSNRNWDMIHDFTPIESETNWDFIEDSKVSDFIDAPISSEVSSELEKLHQLWTNPLPHVEINVVEPRIDMETFM